MSIVWFLLGVWVTGVAFMIFCAVAYMIYGPGQEEPLPMPLWRFVFDIVFWPYTLLVLALR